MGSSRHSWFVLSFFFLVSFTCFMHSTEALVGSQCNFDANYSRGTQMEKNVMQVLKNLVNASKHSAGFNKSVVGNGNDTIYGMVQCRGDTTAEQCYNCSRDSIGTIHDKCGTALGATFWFDLCYLRFENYSFFENLDTNLATYIANGQNVSNPDSFQPVVRGLLGNLSRKAMEYASMYASGISNATFPKIYGLVQCWQDISLDDCQICLDKSMNIIFTDAPSSSGAQRLSANCEVRYEIYSFFSPTPPPSSSPPKLPPATQSPPVSPAQVQVPKIQKADKSKNKLPMILGASGGFVVLLLLVCSVGCFVFRRRPCSTEAIATANDAATAEEDEILSEDRSLLFSMESLKIATNNFNEGLKLGQGGWGVVYKGTLLDGTNIAVKKLSFVSCQGYDEFMNEIELVANIQHRNLVKMHGCCIKGSNRILIYEYLLNGSLDKVLFGDFKRRKQFEWQKRHRVIIGIAKGLLYLHEDSKFRIIHRDIKASNILLDDKFNPKIADFGLAKLFSGDETHVQTRAAGTYGYMAPEYALRGQLSTKADVYSFGVLLLEIISAKKAYELDSLPDFQNLLEWTWTLYQHGNVMDIVDEALTESCMPEEAIRCIHVALLCVQAYSSQRPTMSTVLMMLSSSTITLPIPAMPAFVNMRHERDFSLSELEGR